MARAPSKIPCKTCGKKFVPPKSPKGGRPAEHCEDHRKARGEIRDVEGAADRKQKRKEQMDAGEERAAIAAPFHETRDLAAALALFEDLEGAARYVGIGAAGAQLAELAARARALHPGVVELDRAELGRQILSALFLITGALVKGMGMIAPRDLPHVARALAQVHAIMVGNQIPPFAELRMFVVGADGVPFDPNSIPQFDSRVETPPAPATPTKH